MRTILWAMAAVVLVACNPGQHQVAGSATWQGVVTSDADSFHLEIGSADIQVDLSPMPVTLTLQPDAAVGADTTISQGNPNAQYETSPEMGAGQYGSSNSRLRGLLRFDLSAVPVTATVTAATLTLWATSVQNSTQRTVGLHQALTPWAEGGATWNHRDAGTLTPWGAPGGLAGTDYQATPSVSRVIGYGDGTAYDFDVLTDVAGWASAPASNMGWWIINASEGSTSTRKSFGSSDWADADQRARLVVTYQPG